VGVDASEVGVREKAHQDDEEGANGQDVPENYFSIGTDKIGRGGKAFAERADFVEFEGMFHVALFLMYANVLKFHEIRETGGIFLLLRHDASHRHTNRYSVLPRAGRYANAAKPAGLPATGGRGGNHRRSQFVQPVSGGGEGF
jgi:hypothetical protein